MSRDHTCAPAGGGPLPAARRNRSELIFQEVGDEVVVYDIRRERYFALNATAASVWRLCDGATSPQDIAATLGPARGLTDEQARAVVDFALARLSRSGLLEPGKGLEPHRKPSPGRRELLKALAGVISLPLVSSLLAPSASAQFSVPCVGCGPCFPPNNQACWSASRGCYCTRNRNQCLGTGGIPC